MRLSPEQAHVITSEIQAEDQDAKIYLYGSRTKDHLRGGDIDLLVISSPDKVEQLQKKQFSILSRIKKSKYVGDRKIDLKFSSQAEMTSDPFLISIKDDLVLLASN